MRGAVVALSCLLVACAPAREGTAVRSLEGGSSTACATERQVVTAAVDAYVLLTPSVPVTEAALVDEKFLRAPSQWFDIAADGAVVAAPHSPCA